MRTASRLTLALTSAVAASLLAGSAFGYALNAHVAICQHVLESLPTAGTTLTMPATGQADLTPLTSTHERLKHANPLYGVVAGAAATGSYTLSIKPELVAIARAYPAYFRGGCTAPDAFPFFGNTDPSHSYGWDPGSQFETLWRHASTNEERAWVLGWGAHLAVDAHVHSFANTYSGITMQRRGRLKGALRPQVWNTFIPENFLAHVAAEGWINNYFIYAVRPENTLVKNPESFARRMFLERGSPIVNHYSRVLTNWRKGKSGDINVAVGGEAPGALATMFHRAIEHLNEYEELHHRQWYTWKGHANFYAGKSGLGDQLHLSFANYVAEWHQKRVGKIRAIYDAWVKATGVVQQTVAARADFGPVLQAFHPFMNAIGEYLTFDVVSIQLPPALGSLVASVQRVFTEMTEGIRKAVSEAINWMLDPLMERIKENLRAVFDKGLVNGYFDGTARNHARTLLKAVGLVKNINDSEAGAPVSRNAGIDGAATPAENAANRLKLLAYPFYRNAFVGVVQVFSDPTGIRGLASADFTNGARCLSNVAKTRAHGTLRNTFILKGADPLFNSTTESCTIPTHTRMATSDFTLADLHTKYQGLLAASQGFSIRESIADMLRVVGGGIAQAGKWLWDKLRVQTETLIQTTTTALGLAVESAKATIAQLTAQAATVVGNAVRKVVDWGKYNTCNLACTANWVPLLTCWKGRGACGDGRTACYGTCDVSHRR